MIEIFDVHRPGPDSKKLPTITKRKSKKGQKGIISCLDFCPDYSGLYAAGSYSQSIGIYDETNNELCLKLTGFEGGTTQVKFSKDGTLLFSASRHSNDILCWDIRDSANILFQLNRPGKTNQRISFDMDATGKYLITGDQEGHVLIYDITTGESEDVETKERLVHSFKAHNDVTSCATFNPVYPVIASCSGQRKFVLPQDESDESDDDEDEQVIDNTLKVWRVSGQYQWYTYDVESTDMTTGTTDMVTETTDMVTETTEITTVDMVTETGTHVMVTETATDMVTETSTDVVSDQMTAAAAALESEANNIPPKSV
ncbi:WD40-repeat-containing domain protein [Mucor mucedo]|uniref:WD40-repeat-containing domain protein n=1 Tax=Mucor mucedo TaxID=29922 RepID=UPI00221ECCF8|nr:WD40-repeat-containing domain protein [Mucor mucedo]KAI7889516.1 WD40-repeat-containing domain protein [Mucor mucedo]